MNKIRPLLVRIHWLLANVIAFDPPRLIRSIRGLPNYIKEWRKFRQKYKGKMIMVPCLGDRYEEGGATGNEYFWQDLIVARAIHESKPIKHVDIGSRVDGFIAHVASFRECEVFDIRSITAKVPGVLFRQADLMKLETSAGDIYHEYCDSISCLHAIEHFGLGRYGDPINVKGYQHGITNIARLLKPEGTFYLSTPIGEERVEFNANWVFDPNTIVTTANAVGLRLDELTVLDQQGDHETVVRPTAEKLDLLAKEHYRLGIFHFLKEGGH